MRLPSHCGCNKHAFIAMGAWLSSADSRGAASLERQHPFQFQCSRGVTLAGPAGTGRSHSHERAGRDRPRGARCVRCVGVRGRAARRARRRARGHLRQASGRVPASAVMLRASTCPSTRAPGPAHGLELAARPQKLRHRPQGAGASALHSRPQHQHCVLVMEVDTCMLWGCLENMACASNAQPS